MKTSTLLKSQKGFSLVELMIVVAIIGILAAIGIPQYAKFQARARQSEAKGSLSSLYTSEQSFHGEWTVYSTDLPDIGFAVTGVNLRYITGFDAAVTCGGAWPGNAPVEDGAKDTATLASTGVTFANGITLTNFPLTGSACANPVGGATGTSTFTGAASGTPRNSIESTVDRWTINNNKVVTNTANGL